MKKKILDSNFSKVYSLTVASYADREDVITLYSDTLFRKPEIQQNFAKWEVRNYVRNTLAEMDELAKRMRLPIGA